MFKLVSDGELRYLVIEEFLEFGVLAAFSLRHGGFSPPPYDSLNMGLATADSRENVIRNRGEFLRALEIPVERVVSAHQVHATDILEVDPSDRNRRLTADGLMTNDDRTALMGFYADCVPLYFLDTKTGAYALAHAGWRGTLARIGPKMVEAMADRFGSAAAGLITGIGPCIGGCCYEVGPDVAGAFALTSRTYPDGTYRLDLVEENRKQLIGAGVRPEAIFSSGYCTSCSSHMFFSHRASGGVTGRMAALITGGRHKFRNPGLLEGLTARM